MPYSLLIPVTMNEYQNQSHVRYECKYHIVWYPEYRRKKLYGRLGQRFGEMIHDCIDGLPVHVVYIVK
ncbi:MAG: hypothetical protein U9R57_01700 [Thermodesulfobacteriota bacterium]|nr:hypothetical protein [Thermodesulfobacteriota bacterium]